MKVPDLSGNWKFNPGRSALQIKAPESTVFLIEHRDPVFLFCRIHVFDKKEDTFSMELTTDGSFTIFERGNLHITARAYWDSETLVFESTLMQDGREASNIVRYDLTDEGATLIGTEQFRSSDLNYDNVWIMERVTQKKS